LHSSHFSTVVAHVRAGEGPGLLRLHVPRLHGHTFIDDQAYKTPEQRTAEADRDPIPRLRDYLFSQGLTPGDCVGVLFDRSIHAYIGLVAVLKINATYVPLDPSFPTRRISFIAEDTSMSAIVTLSAFADRLTGAVPCIISLDTVEHLTVRESARRLNGREKGSPQDDLCYIIE